MKASRLNLPLLVALTTIPAVIIGGVLWWASDFVPQCEPTVLDEQPSPDGENVLTTFSLQCGLDTAANIQAAIHAAGEPFDTETASVFLSAYDIGSVDAAWQDARRIAVSIAEGARVNRRLETVGDIMVSYR